MIFQCCTSVTQREENANASADESSEEIWSKEKANEWYADQGWLVGSNFSPSTAINQLEMWQAETFDTATINRELGWAAKLGMNTMRVYLHDLPYRDDAEGFLSRIDKFLAIADRHDIKILFVLFDSVWDPFPASGKQRDPKPHVHNSGWVQSPGADALKDSTQYPRLERYVKGVIAQFANDDRVLAWDLWNEPDNTNDRAYGKVELKNKVDYVLPLLKRSFEWARSVKPSQPLTSAVWVGDWSTHESLARETEYLLSREVEQVNNSTEELTIEEQITEINQQIENYKKAKNSYRFILESEYASEIDKDRARKAQADYDAKITELEARKAELEAQLKTAQ